MNHSSEAERAILAILLDGRHPDAFPLAFVRLGNSTAFYIQAHRLIWIACQGIAQRGERIDGMAVSAELQAVSYGQALDALAWDDGDTRRNRPKLDPSGPSYDDSALAGIGGPVVLGDIAQEMAHRQQLPGLLDTVAAHAVQRKAMAVAKRIGDALAQPSGARSAPKLIGSAIDELSRIAEPTAGMGTLGEGATAALASHDETERSGLFECATWGLPELDALAELRMGSVWALAAPTKTGKTSMLLHAMEATALRYGPGSVAMVSREMGAQELGAIVLCRRLCATRHAMDRGLLTADQRKRADAVRKELLALDIGIRDGMTCTAAEACAWARQRHAMTGGKLKLFAVDHLGILTRSHQRQTEYDMIVEATSMFKSLARTLKICVIQLAQFNREGTKQDRKGGVVGGQPEPRLSDLKGSSSIEQDSDGVLFLYKPQVAPPGMPENVIAKTAANRSGPLGEAHLIFSGAYGQKFTSSHQDEASTRARKLDAKPSDAEDVFK